MSVTATLRRFNRTYTQRVGVLDESHLGSGRPLNVSRLLFEIDAAGAVTIRGLRDRLGLDSGYLTRMLGRLEQDGLVRVRTDPADRRRRVVEPTEAGRAAAVDLEERSERRAAELIEPLTPRQQERLADALATADLLVRAATVRLVEVEQDSDVARLAVGHYIAELDARFPDGFDPGAPLSPEPGARYVAVLSEGEVVAYGGIRRISSTDGGTTADVVPTAEVKRMWVDPRWRGAGLGGRLLRHLEALATEHGFARARLDTNKNLTEAIALYERSGYTSIDRYNDNPYAELFFEKLL